MARIGLVDAYLGGKMLPVEIGGAEEMVMGEKDGVDPWQCGV